MNINGKWNVYKFVPHETPVQLTPSNGRYYLSCIRPDSAYAVCQGGSFEDILRIWKIDLQTKDMQRISPEHLSGWTPSYSWDGEHIVFSSETQPDKTLLRIKEMPTFFTPQDTIPMAICMCDADGHHFQQLTSGEYMDVRPTFSPDSRFVAFISKRSGVWKLWELALDSPSEPYMIEANYPWAMRPWYSKDGHEIYFHTEIEKRHSIMRYHKVNRTLLPLKNDVIGNTHGSFTMPQEDAILAHSDRGGRPGLWKFPLNGEEPEEIKIDPIKIKAHATISRDGIIIFDSPDDD